MPISCGRCSHPPRPRWFPRIVPLLTLLPGVWLAGCATTLPALPRDPIDRLPFIREVPLSGNQAPETEGGPVYAVRWTVRSCPVEGSLSRHIVIGTRGSTSQAQATLPPDAVAALVVCEEQNGASVLRKIRVHHGVDVPTSHYEPASVPFVELQDNTLEILAFEPGPLVLEAQPVDAHDRPVGPPHRFNEMIINGRAWRQEVSDTLAKMREERLKALSSSDALASGGSSFFPAVPHVQY